MSDAISLIRVILGGIVPVRLGDRPFDLVLGTPPSQVGTPVSYSSTEFKVPTPLLTLDSCYCIN